MLSARMRVVRGPMRSHGDAKVLVPFACHGLSALCTASLVPFRRRPPTAKRLSSTLCTYFTRSAIVQKQQPSPPLVSTLALRVAPLVPIPFAKMATQTALPGSLDAAGNQAHAGESQTGSDSGSSHNARLKTNPHQVLAAGKNEPGVEAKQIADLLESQRVQVEGDAAKDPTLRANGLPTFATGLRRRNHSPLHRSLMRKVDWQIVPIALIVYFLSFLDRSNIATGRLNGLETDLKMVSPPNRTADYTIAVVCLYPTYILFEIPSNLLIKRVSPKLWIPGLLTAWGIVSTLQGTATTKEGLFIARAFLGLAEAGILPGLALWLTFFYKDEELMLRQALYFSGASLSGAFSGLLSVAIGKMGGIGGKGGWAWIFIVS